MPTEKLCSKEMQIWVKAGIEIIKGSSDFTNILGFTSGGTQSATTVEGDTAQLTSLSAVSSSKRFTEGDFTISLTRVKMLRI